MLKAINHLRSPSPEAREIVSLIDRQFGFEVLSGNYNKMLRLMQGTQSKVARQEDLTLWSLQSMYVLLKRGECTQNDFKTDNFIKAKDGSPSWIAQCLVQRSFMDHIHALVDGVADELLQATGRPVAAQILSVQTNCVHRLVTYCMERRPLGRHA